MQVFHYSKRSDLSPALRLILSCLRLRPDEKEARQIEELSRAKISWPDLLKWVDRHRVAPLVYTNLSRYAGSTVPSAFMSELRSRFERNARRGLANAAELVQVYKLFQGNGIPALPLKGSVLALQIYGNLALRHAGDIDLLVEGHHFDRADRLLRGNYRRTMPAFRLTSSQRRRFLRLQRHFGYLDDQSKLRIELHWRLINNQPDYVMDLPRLRSRASTVAVAGWNLPALSIPDNVLYLCGHGEGHFWSRLFWLVDLAEIIRGNPAIDWHHLMTLASESGLLRSLALGFSLAHELLEVPLPKVIRTYALQDRVASYSAKVAHRFMLCPEPTTPPFTLSLQGHLCSIRYGNSFQEQLITFHQICLGEDWLTLPLPDSLFFLYYLLRFPLWLQRRLGNSQLRHIPSVGQI